MSEHRWRTLPKQLLGFATVGAASMLIYAIVSSVLVTMAGWQAWVASTVVYGMLIPPAYLAQRKISFQTAEGHRVVFMRYVVATVSGLVAAAVLAQIFHGAFALPPLVSFALVAVTMAAFNFAVLRFWVFRDFGG
jgi:putative flippase GtrA